MSLNLAAIQKQLWSRRAEENRAFQKERAFQEEQEKQAEAIQNMNSSYNSYNKIRKNLNKTYNKRKGYNTILQNYYKNPYNLTQPRKRNTGTMRKRENPEFKSLGIPVPPSQKVGSTLVSLGAKIKKNGGRRTRRHRAK